MHVLARIHVHIYVDLALTFKWIGILIVKEVLLDIGKKFNPISGIISDTFFSPIKGVLISAQSDIDLHDSGWMPTYIYPRYRSNQFQAFS